MSDLISRQAAIDGFYEMASDIDHLCTVGDYISFLKSLSAQPKRKKGKWIHGKELSRLYIGDACVGIDYEDFHCSVCNVVVEEPCKPTWNFCPNCGAEMRGEEDVDND